MNEIEEIGRHAQLTGQLETINNIKANTSCCDLNSSYQDK